jgi:hypothetical protein
MKDGWKVGDYVMSREKYSLPKSEYVPNGLPFDYLYGVISDIDYNGSSINIVIITGTTLKVSFYNTSMEIDPDGKVRERNDKLKKLGI